MKKHNNTKSKDELIQSGIEKKRSNETMADDFIAAEAAINEALAQNIAVDDLIAAMEPKPPEGKEELSKELAATIESLIKESELQNLIRQIIADDFKKTAAGENTLSTEAAQKLGLFSLGVVNAVANSFMGLPSAAILVALDNLFTHPLTMATLTGPDKLLLIIIAFIILAIFIKIAYKQNYIKPEEESEYLKQVYDTFAQYICSNPEPEEAKNIVNKALYNKYLAENIIAIRSGHDNGKKKEGLLLAEQEFQAAAAGHAPKPRLADSEAKIKAIMKPVFLTTAAITAIPSGYALAIIFTTQAFLPVLYIIPVLCTMLLIYQIIKYCVTEYYDPKRQLTSKDEYYLALYRVMKKYRVNNEIHLGNCINEVSNNDAIKEAIMNYMRSYIAIEKELTEDQLKQLQKIDDDYIMLSHNNYQRYLSEVGQVLGVSNAILNGILCCAFGIAGIIAVIAIFVPGFQLSLGITIVAGVALFLGGTIHSFRFTRPYVASVFRGFGQTLDKIKVSDKNISTKEWLKILVNKVFDNRKAITISFFTSVALSVLGFIAISNLLLTFPISMPIVITVLIVTTLLNFISCISLFTKTFQDKEQREKDLAKLQKSLPEYERNNIQQLKSRINMHYALGAIMTLITFIVCVSPPLALTVVPALFIASLAFFIVFMGSAIIDSNNIKGKHSLSTVLDLRLRICIITLFGLAFGISSGPAVGALVFSVLPAAIMPSSVILAISVLFGLAIGASLCYAYSLVYWNEAVKPADHKIEIVEALTKAGANEPSKAAPPVSTPAAASRGPEADAPSNPSTKGKGSGS